MPNSPSGESVIQRVARVLEAFGGDDTALSTAEIARRADLPESTARRMVQALLDEGLLQRGPDQQVAIGHRLWAHISRTSPTLRLREAAAAYLEDVQAVIGHHTALSVLDGDDVLYIDRLAAHTSTVSIASFATRLPWHTVSAGILLVAHDDPAEQDRRLARRLTALTPLTVTDPDALRVSLQRARGAGYAICSATSVASSSGISVPVHGPDGAVVAALGVIVPVGHERLPESLPVLRAAARGVSRGLGWRGDRDVAHWSAERTAIQ